ncbi:MAG: glycoside hydrolase family 2 protein [Planctomycetota bacterium]|jgi:hypothetical protein
MNRNTRHNRLAPAFGALIVMAIVASPAVADYKPAPSTLLSPWAAEVSPINALPDYPRPQMVREDWVNLNGLWDYALTPKDAARPSEMDGRILVPFAIESALSGVKKTVGADQRLWYRRDFEAPEAREGDRTLLHFGAVDWHATVFVNGKGVGQHKGGYDPFTFDITGALKKAGPQELVVSVWDPTDKGLQARGKQVSEPAGIWYTAVTGIWQTVWLETVPAGSIARLKITPDVDAGTLNLMVEGRGDTKGVAVRAVATIGGRPVEVQRGRLGKNIELTIDDARLWSPDDPFLYDLEVSLLRGRKLVDRVESYFGMRKIELGKDSRGFTRFMLNDEPLFQYGPLDQGWWPGGLYTAPTDAALRYDLEVTKRLGFNMLRKHVKVEPARFYYHCDTLGILVWQDMPNGNYRKTEPDNLRVAAESPVDADRPKASARQFEAEWKSVIETLYGAPSIIMWVPFNEGWGQYDTARIARYTRSLDPTRLVNSASGWTDRGVGDMIDVHIYPGPGMEPAEEKRASVLGEFGGLGWPIEQHLWGSNRNWGYRTYYSREELNREYANLLKPMPGLLAKGLTAAIYTQTTDVEGEVNGLMTYDRKVVKFDEDAMNKLHDALYAEPAMAKTLLADSEFKPSKWRVTQEKVKGDWKAPGFDDSTWDQKVAPFAGANGSFFIPKGTVWHGKEMLMRKSFELDTVPDSLYLKAFCNLDVGDIFLNGKLVLQLEDRSKRHYRHYNLSRHVGVLKPGKNTLAVRVERKTPGPRNIDVGLYTAE